MPELLSEHACFGGVQRFYKFESAAIGLPMRYSVFLPPGFEGKRLPVLFYLAGLTCTEETFMIKAGAQRVAAQEGLILVTPDTSPRGAGVPGETDSWDFGVGAGFYVDAVQEPWSQHYRMYSHILELRELVLAELPADPARVGIFGHSMGGHGALMLALKQSRAVPLGLGLRADRRTDALSLGPESLRRLSRRGRGGLGASTTPPN
jgi:S-formylglutathione hydrolase